MPTYIINSWDNDCSCLFRSTNRKEWLEKIKELFLNNKDARLTGRTIERSNGTTVFSFINQIGTPAYFRWINAEILDGINVEYVLPEELRDLLWEI